MPLLGIAGFCRFFGIAGQVGDLPVVSGTVYEYSMMVLCIRGDSGVAYHGFGIGSLVNTLSLVEFHIIIIGGS